NMFILFFLFLYLFFFFFFFFQAEDGIRDFHVTGVQTCALPIYSPLPIVEEGMRWEEANRSLWPNSEVHEESLPAMPVLLLTGVRSEERRVGKECRSRLGP